MRKIFVRKPNYITINESGQVGSKIELRFRKFNTAFPTDPDYVLVKKIPSPTQLKTTYNISNYAKSFITITTPSNIDIAVFCEIKRFKEDSIDVYTLLDTEEVVCFNGFAETTTANNFPLLNPNIKIQRFENSFYNYYFSAGTFLLNNESILVIEDAGVNTIGINAPQNTVGINAPQNTVDQGATLLTTINSELICEPKYTPKLVWFINRFGGWQPLTFFKASKENIQVKSEKYKTFGGETRKYNNNGQKSIVLNTGWVHENYKELIEDLLLTEHLFIIDKKANVKTESVQLKTRLTDKMINYEIEFEYAFDIIDNA